MAVDFTGGAGRRAFGHGGMASSRGLADPEAGLVMVVVSNGLPDPIAAERRSAEVTDAVYTRWATGAARFRRTLGPERAVGDLYVAAPAAAMSSRMRSCTAGGPATMSPDGARPFVARPVGHHAAGLADDQPTGGDVPRAEALLEVAVEDAGRRPGEVEARGPGPAEVLELAQRPLEDREVLVEAPALGTEREAGGGDRLLGHRSLTHADALAVAERAAAPARR